MNSLHNLSSAHFATENRSAMWNKVPPANNSAARYNLTAQNDPVSISIQGKSRSTAPPVSPANQNEKTGNRTSPSDSAIQLTVEEQQILQDLQQRDAEVRAHEQAHLAIAGQYAAGAASYTYQTGPNGKKYAVGGEVPIDVSKESTPEETLQKMQIVARAAMAPLNPSAADRQIAARAAAISAQARMEIQKENIFPEKKESASSLSNSEHQKPSPSETIANDAEQEPSFPDTPLSSKMQHMMALKAYRSQVM
ncbi:MAG: putative metalloprotease CJM1_0395 family protein [Desulfopila sp.]|nr:putative metalloprotease CJM1_0395 family protein [Desulfopila sp.]